jgi:arginine deiminase
LVCEPGTETLFDLLQPNAANFLHPFSLAQAQAEHRAFRQQLEEHGVRVIDLRQALLNGVGANDEARARLQAWARQSIQLDTADLAADDAALAAADLAASLDALDPAALVDLILLAPTIRLSANPEALDPTTRFLARYELAGGSAYYLRDPLFTTRNGVVIGRLRLEKRRRENDLAAFALAQLGVSPIYRVRPPGFIEGGDFIPAGDFVLQGQGLLSDADGIGQCLEQRVYGEVEVAVVRDPCGQMEEMHLDTYFAFLSPTLCLLCETRLKPSDEPEVDVYQPDGDSHNFCYRLVRRQSFSRYLGEKGVRILTFSTEESKNFAPNGLLLGPNHWLGVRQAGPDLFDRLQRHGIDVIPLDFAALSGGYGGPHCSTQVVERG